jgi:hypothetical protein
MCNALTTFHARQGRDCIHKLQNSAATPVPVVQTCKDGQCVPKEHATSSSSRTIDASNPFDIHSKLSQWRACQQLKSFETQVDMFHHDEQEHWYWVFRVREVHWSLSRLEEDLLAANNEVPRLCPDDLCMKPEDQILWEYHSLEASYNKAQRAKSPEVTCEWYLAVWKEWAHIPDRQCNCIINRQRERSWLELAYSQARAEVETRCAASGHDLVPQLTLGSSSLHKSPISNPDIHVHSHMQWKCTPGSPRYLGTPRKRGTSLKCRRVLCIM